MVEEEPLNPEGRDLNNKEIPDRLSETFRATLEPIRESAEEQGVDLDSVDVQAEAAEERRRTEEAETGECCCAAKQYAERVDEWFESANGLFGSRERELRSEALLGLPGCDPEKEALDLKDAVEVIRWYRYQIYIKLMRAMTGETKGKPEMVQDFPKDSDESAEVALIGTDRSIGAWGEMRRRFPEREDEILGILAHVDTLRGSVEPAFPSARSFVRPRFDELPE